MRHGPTCIPYYDSCNPDMKFSQEGDTFFCCRINTKTGEVRRQCLFAQSNDHPRVNPSFYSRPTRYCYVNMCMSDDADLSNPPQVGQQSDPPAAAAPVPVASNIVPAPAFLGKTWQSIPDEVLTPTASSEESDFSWTTRASANASSMLPTELPIGLPRVHAYQVRDTTPYTEVPLPVGGVPVEPTTPFRQSILTAKDRLSKLSRLDFSTLSMSLDIPWDQDDQQDQGSQAESGDPTPFSSLSTFATVDSSMEEDDTFPVTANKVQGKKAGSTREMGSLEWLNLSSGPPKANSPTICPLTLLFIHMCAEYGRLITQPKLADPTSQTTTLCAQTCCSTLYLSISARPPPCSPCN